MALSDRAILEAEYRQLAKKADQRMVRLEKLSTQQGFTSVKKYAYAKAERNIVKKWGGSETKPRFNTTPKGMSDRDLTRKISDIRSFLDAPSSTKKDIVKIYQKGADTVNKKYPEGAKLTWEDIAKFYSSKTADKLKTQFKNSSVMLLAIKSIKAIGIENISKKDIQKATAKTLTISDDKIVNDVAIRMLKEHSNAMRQFDIFHQ